MGRGEQLLPNRYGTEMSGLRDPPTINHALSKEGHMTSDRWPFRAILLASVAVSAAVVVAAGMGDGGNHLGDIRPVATGTSTEETAKETTTSRGRGSPDQEARRGITITPRSGPPGTLIVVRGTGCPPPTVAVVATTRNGTEEEGAQVAVPDEDGTWSERQTALGGADPDDRYAVIARCAKEDGSHFYYPPQPFHVTSAAPVARPVTARPTFTG